MARRWQADFVLESIWQPGIEAAPGLYRLILSNHGATPIADFRLGLSGPARIGEGAKLRGGRLLHQLSNYAEIAPEAGFVLQEGASWTIEIDGLDNPIRHWTDGATAGFVIRADGTTIPALTMSTRHATSEAPRLRGTMTLPVDAGAGGPVSVLPWPREIVVKGMRGVPAGLHITSREPAASAFAQLAGMLFPGEGMVRALEEGGFPVHLVLGGEGHGREGYALDWDTASARIEAETQNGLLYGLITLGQIWRGARREPSRFGFPASGRIADAPAMAWRGCHLDVARRFYGSGEIRQFLAILAWNKLSVFHWHLSDDEAWRIEIDAFPELTEQAAWRGHGLAIPPLLGSGPERSGGYYRKATVRDLVAFAASLCIDTVPEIDVPGHCFALLQALPRLRDPDEIGAYHSVQGFPDNCLNPAVEAVYPALETIFSELIELFPGKYFHVGADEVPSGAWSASPLARALEERLEASGAAALQAHFLKRVQAFLASRGKITGAWEEAARGGGIDKAKSYLVGWHTVDASRRLAAEGYDVVVSPGQAYYLDMANGKSWQEPGAGWAGWSSPETTYAFDPSQGWSTAERTRLMGVQACIWSEPMSDRGVFDRLVFPRLSAIAETGWCGSAGKDWPRFAASAALVPNLYGIFEEAPGDV